MICETTHFISHYHEEEAILAEQFIKLLEYKFEEIQRSFQFRKISCKYTFHLCNSVEEYLTKTGKRKEYQEWMVGFDNFVDNGWYDYAGIYVWYFIKRYGFAKFLEVYWNECERQGMIYDGFEKEALQNYLRYVSEHTEH